MNDRALLYRFQHTHIYYNNRTGGFKFTRSQKSSVATSEFLDMSRRNITSRILHCNFDFRWSDFAPTQKQTGIIGFCGDHGQRRTLGSNGCFDKIEILIQRIWFPHFVSHSEFGNICLNTVDESSAPHRDCFGGGGLKGFPSFVQQQCCGWPGGWLLCCQTGKLIYRRSCNLDWMPRGSLDKFSLVLLQINWICPWRLNRMWEQSFTSQKKSHLHPADCICDGK